MKCKYGVLSFCLDLTDPNSRSIPIAVVGVSVESSTPLWFLAAKSRLGDSIDIGLDDASRALLNSLPALIERQVVESGSQVGPDGFLTWLHDRFRNSLHVSSIKEREVNGELSANDVSELFRLEVLGEVDGPTIIPNFTLETAAFSKRDTRELVPA